MTAIGAPELLTGAFGWQLAGAPVRGRTCGGCKACCTQVPVDLIDGHKPAHVRCKHLVSRGCRIYANRPTPCAYWSCRWLFDDETRGLRRPDLSGYIIDCMTDTIMADGDPLEVVQIWVDPARPRAHEDPALRDYLALVAKNQQMAAIVRWNSRDGLVLVAPCMTKEREWLEITTGLLQTKEEMAAMVAASRKALRPPGDAHA